MDVTSRFVLLCSLFCAVALPAGAAAKPSPTNFRFAATLPVLVAAGSAAGAGIATTPSEITVPHVGKATVTVQWFRLTVFTCGPPPCLNSKEGGLSVSVGTRGGRLVIVGTAGPFFVPSGSDFPPDSAVMTGPWAVDEASGRFAGYAGTGTWSISAPTGPPPEPHGTVTVTLTGHIHPG